MLFFILTYFLIIFIMSFDFYFFIQNYKKHKIIDQCSFIIHRDLLYEWALDIPHGSTEKIQLTDCIQVYLLFVIPIISHILFPACFLYKFLIWFKKQIIEFDDRVKNNKYKNN